MTPAELATLILSELGDPTESIWTSAEIIDYIQTALWDFKARTLYQWVQRPLDDFAGQATYPIPQDYGFHQMDRVTWDDWVVNPVVPRATMSGNGYFETTGNRPLSYMMEGDGVDVVRKIGVPATDTTNECIIEFFSFGTETMTNARLESGDAIQGSQEVSGVAVAPGDVGRKWRRSVSSPYYTIIAASASTLTLDRPYAESNYSLDAYIFDFSTTEDIQLPLRYLTYISHRVKSMAYGRDGDGQSLKMEKFWADWYEDGVNMILRRTERLFRRRISNIGNDGKVPESSRHRDPGTLPAYFPKVE
jgi:hypothetical protein